MQCFPVLFVLISATWCESAMVTATDAPIQCAKKEHHRTEAASPCRPFPFWRSTNSSEAKTSDVNHAFDPYAYLSRYDPVYDEAVYGITASCDDLPNPQTHSPAADPWREFEAEKTGNETGDDLVSKDSNHPFEGCWSHGRVVDTDDTDPSGALRMMPIAADSFSRMGANIRIASQTLWRMFVSGFAR